MSPYRYCSLPGQPLCLLTGSQYHNGAKAYAPLPQAILNAHMKLRGRRKNQ